MIICFSKEAPSKFGGSFLHTSLSETILLPRKVGWSGTNKDEDARKGDSLFGCGDGHREAASDIPRLLVVGRPQVLFAASEPQRRQVHMHAACAGC